MNNRQPIDTAPRDGTVVDIFVECGGRGHWIEGVHWGELAGEAPEDDDMGWLKNGTWARGEDQWPTYWRPNGPKQACDAEGKDG